jgi:Uma2 family endonuclease
MQLPTFEEKRRKFLPKVPRAIGTPTAYLEGYPTEDGEPMSATNRHGRQIATLSYQLQHYFRDIEPAYVGIDSFVYYIEGDFSTSIAPDVYVALGVLPKPERRSFYTWREGAVPTVAFEFLSDSTAADDRTTKLKRYLLEIGIREYFIHQPDLERRFEFRAWRRQGDGYEEIVADGRGGLYSEALNLWFLVEEYPDEELRLMRPYLPDWTPIPTYEELKAEREAAKMEAEIAQTRAEAAEARLDLAQTRAEAAEARLEIAEERALAAKARAGAAEIRIDVILTELSEARAQAIEAEARADRAEAEAAEARVLATQAEARANQAEVRASRAETNAAEARAQATQAETDAAEAKSIAASQAQIIEAMQEDIARIREMLESPGRS